MLTDKVLALVKGKGFPYCYRELGSELIPVYRQPTQRWL